MATVSQDDLSTSVLARSAASGVRWTSLSGATIAALNAVQTLVVAHLLKPSDFGLMVSAMVLVALGGAFSDAGLATAIVARKTTREALSSLYWMNLLLGALVGGIVFALAPVVAAFYDQPRLEGIVRTVSLIFVISPIGQQFGWLLEKELRFRTFGIVQIISATVGTAVTIAGAALGAGVYALVVGMLVTGLTGSLMLAAIAWSEWRPILRFRWSDVRSYMDFGLYQMGERSINYLASNTDYILIGRFLGPASLGTYSIAYQLVIKPVIYLNPMLNRVAFPVLATRQDDDDALRRGYLHVVRLIAYVTLPLMLGLALVTSDFVDVVLGSKWEASAPVLAVLCGVGALRSLANPVGSILLAKNRPDLGFKGNLILLVAMAGVLAAAVQSGIMAVAWASLGVTAVAWFAWLLVLRKVVGLSLYEYASALRPPVIFAVVMATAVGALQLVLAEASVGSAFALVASITLGAAVYVGVVLRFDSRYVHSLWRLFRTRASPA
jgi:O-antigen/teichoic acid export membrane protein